MNRIRELREGANVKTGRSLSPVEVETIPLGEL